MEESGSGGLIEDCFGPGYLSFVTKSSNDFDVETDFSVLIEVRHKYPLYPISTKINIKQV